MKSEMRKKKKLKELRISGVDTLISLVLCNHLHFPLAKLINRPTSKLEYNEIVAIFIA